MIATWLAPLGLLSKKPAFQQHRLGLFAGSKQTVHFLFPFSTEGSHNSKYHQGPEWFKSKHSPDHRPLVRGRTLEGKPPRSSLETREYTGAWGLLFLNAGGSPTTIDTCLCFLLSQPQGIDPSAKPGEYRLVLIVMCCLSQPIEQQDFGRDDPVWDECHSSVSLVNKSIQQTQKGTCVAGNNRRPWQTGPSG